MTDVWQNDSVSALLRFSVLGTEPRASHMLGKCSVSELDPKASSVLHRTS